MRKIAILVPCYNEAKTIKKVVEDYKKAIPKADIYVYDNNSKDGTDKIAKEAGAIVRYEYAQGKGNVVRSMFRDIDADCYIMIDGDDTYPAEYAKDMSDLILSGKADMVVGDRLSTTYFQENKRFGHSFGNKLVTFLVRDLFDANVNDVMTGYRAYSKEFVKSFPVLSKGFEIETEMAIHAADKRMHVLNFPVVFRERPEGSISKLNTYKDGFKILRTIVRLLKEYRPRAVYNLKALLCFLIMALSVIFYNDNSSFLYIMITLISALTGIIMIATGEILHILAVKDRKNFEITLNTLAMIDKTSEDPIKDTIKEVVENAKGIVTKTTNKVKDAKVKKDVRINKKK